MVLFRMKSERIFQLLDAAEMLHRATVRRAELAERDVERQALEIELLTPESKEPIRSLTDLAKCNKRAFKSSDAATRAFTGGHAVRSYKCPRCQQWHLTKRDYA